MKTGSKTAPMFERLLLLLGLLLLGMFAFAHAHRFIMVRVEMARFESNRLGAAEPRIHAFASADHNAGPRQARGAGYALWSSERIRSHAVTLSKPVEALAVLRIPKVGLEVPVLDGTNAFTLNRGVGRIAGTAYPGQEGNMGIAGHRDGFFRSLKEISTGDVIELVTTSGTDVYVVDQIRITSPDDVSVLKSRANRSLTLVTCHPFYFVGPSPTRYVVEASLRQ